MSDPILYGNINRKMIINHGITWLKRAHPRFTVYPIFGSFIIHVAKARAAAQSAQTAAERAGKEQHILEQTLQAGNGWRALMGKWQNFHYNSIVFGSFDIVDSTFCLKI